jgi:hypothetical protein
MRTSTRTWAKRTGKCLAIFCLLLWLHAPPLVLAGELSGFGAEQVTLTQYDDAQLLVKIHATRVFLDHEKYGFFRFGLAPLAVVQGTQVQIESASRLTNALAGLNAWKLSSDGPRRLEIRDLEISLLGQKEPRLRAATARPAAAGVLELTQVALPGSSPATLPKATLQMTGPAAGRLRWRDGQKEAELFVFKLPDKP